jgi:hypothetical protein
LYIAVFPSATEGLQGDAVANYSNREQGDNVSRQVFDDGSDAWFDSSMQSLGDEADLAENVSFDVTGNGLYWFWDATWGEHRT